MAAAIRAGITGTPARLAIVTATTAISRVNVEINRGPAADIDDLLVRAEDLTTAVRREIAP
ncbi:hypothetical protein [Fodinicola feengrottensis]|uniref:hypothetical protein n=1 Tax=Fodinicola feengrottensis TaxID=435914 RepID=UPI0013D7A510|nr:hypothetical protein [Fodinicola feengrottensis]